MNHKCPGPGCRAEISYEVLACRRHWYQVTPATRKAVWRAWADGRGAGSAEHTAAIERAIAEMKP